MKKCFLIVLAILSVNPVLFSQTQNLTYPEPEFSNEVYYFNKNDGSKLVRLEKGSSKMDTKTKMGGFGGSESGYSIDGSKSPIRLNGGSNLSFVISSGASSGSSSRSDSTMRANGIDPATIKEMSSMMDPIKTITLYKLDTEKGERKVLLMKSGGALPFSSHKSQSSDKYTFSAKKIRDGYWELVIDKTLPRGEYAFTMMETGMASASGGTLLFAFGID